MGETLFNTFKFDFLNKKPEDDEPVQKPKKKKKKPKPEPKKEPEPTKTEEVEQKPVEPEKRADSVIKHEPLKARASDLPNPDDPALNFFGNNNSTAVPSNMRSANGFTKDYPSRAKSISSSPIVEEKFQYNRRYMYDSNGDLVSYE